MEVSILPIEPVTSLQSTKFLVIRRVPSHVLVGISMLVVGLIIYVINMASWMRNIAPVTATCETIVDRLPSLGETKIERHHRKKTEEEESKEQQQDNDDHYDTRSLVENQKFPVRVRLLAMCRVELSAVIARLMCKVSVKQVEVVVRG